MREIKFRAWDKANEKMYEVYGHAHDKWFLKGKSYPMPLNAIELMQCTGQEDINGVEIYEGDILQIDKGYGGSFNPTFVTFEEGAFRDQLSNWQRALVIDDSRLSVREVIGNIYENPKLLEENAE